MDRNGLSQIHSFSRGILRTGTVIGWLTMGMATTATAGPAINVGALNEYIQAGKSTLAKRIYNTGDVAAFVRVNVSEILYDSHGSATERTLNTDEIISGKGTGIVSSPPRLIIPVNGLQTNRLVFTGSRDTERYYRVRYIPVVPENNQEFAIDKRDVEAYQQAISAGVTVLSGFGIIVTVQPENVHFATQIDSDKNKLRIINNGNTSIVISDLKSCERDLKNCDSPMTLQLRPGRRLEQTAPVNKIWRYTLTEGSHKKNLSTG